MARVLRGDIYWADLEPVRGHEQGGRRPVLVLSHDLFNDRSGTVIAMALSSRPQRASYPLTWRIPVKLVGKEAWVKISQIRTLSANRLGRRVGRLSPEDVSHIVDGLYELIG